MPESGLPDTAGRPGLFPAALPRAVRARAAPVLPGVAVQQMLRRRSAVRGAMGAQRWRRVPAMVAILGALVSILVSPTALVLMGIPYNLPFGNPILKIHPGSYIVLLALMLALAARNPFSLATHWIRTAAVPVAYLAACVLILLYSLLRYGTSGVAFIVDTLMVPGILLLLLLDATPSLARRALGFLLAALVINALIGIGETITGSRIMPYIVGDEPVIEIHFRATALMAHPLANALATMLGIFALAAWPGRPWRKALLYLIMGIALVGFGSRTSLVITLVLVFALVVGRFLRGLVAKDLLPAHIVGVLAALVVIPIVASAAYIWFDAGVRIVETFYWDSSANARLEAFHIFDLLRPDELVFGISTETIAEKLELLSFYYEVEVIENVWILLLLQFGLILSTIFVIALLTMLLWLARWLPGVGWAMTVAFLIAISSNNSLATKSPALTLFVVLALGMAALHQAERARKRAQRPSMARLPLWHHGLHGLRRRATA